MKGGTISAARADVIRAAYAKIDVNGTSNVTLDDIAKAYDVRGNRDTTTGIRTQEQHYTTFMGVWGLGFADS